jgi:hypothetical protein
MASDYYEKFLSIEGVFLSERQYSWRCGCVPSLGTSESKHKYVWVLYCLYLRNKYYGKLRLHCLDQKTVGVEKKREKERPWGVRDGGIEIETFFKDFVKTLSKTQLPNRDFRDSVEGVLVITMRLVSCVSFVLYVLVFLCSLLFCIWYFRGFLCLSESTLVSMDDY